MYRWRLKVRYDADDGGRTPEGQRRDSGKDSRRDSKSDSRGPQHYLSITNIGSSSFSACICGKLSLSFLSACGRPWCFAFKIPLIQVRADAMGDGACRCARRRRHFGGGDHRRLVEQEHRGERDRECAWRPGMPRKRCCSGGSGASVSPAPCRFCP